MLLRFFFFLLIFANYVRFGTTVAAPSCKRIKCLCLTSNKNILPKPIILKRIYFLKNGSLKGWKKRRKEFLKNNRENSPSQEKRRRDDDDDDNNNTDEEKNTNETTTMYFDDYFNEESPKNYTKLESEKLKIIKESLQSNKQEIREMLAMNYKKDYMKLLKEEEEDAQLSDKVYEGIKITFHMNENINNLLFTQYSNMISKLKEQSSILKNVRSLYEKEKKETKGDALEHPLSSEPTADSEKKVSENNEKTSLSKVEPRLKPVEGIAFSSGKQKDSKDIIEKLTENVHFFKPEKYDNFTRTRTFSEQFFSNVKVNTPSKVNIYGDKIEVNSESDDMEEDDGSESSVLLHSGVSPLQMLKENVKNCLHYKTENIIQNKLSEDHLYGRVKVHWFPKFMRRTIDRIPNFIKMSDIIIEVRNSIIPFVFDDLYSLHFFNFITNKPRIIVYTRSDVSSEKGNEEWGHYYRRKLFWEDKHFNKNIRKEHENEMKKSAVIFVDAKNGGKEIIVLKKLIKRLCNHVIEKKKRKGIVNYKIKCIFLGLPNVGKSALINRLLNVRKPKSENSPGVTKVIQMYSSKNYELIDTPGLLADNLYKIPEKEYNKKNRILENIYNVDPNEYPSPNNIVHIKNYKNYMHIENNIYLLALCNHISAQSYDIYNAAEALIQNMYTSYIYNNDYIDLKKVIKRYQINFTECLNNDGTFSPFHFIQKLARDKFQNDLNKASMRLVSDFRKNYLGKLTLNYPLYFNRKKINLKISKKFVQQKSDKYVGW